MLSSWGLLHSPSPLSRWRPCGTASPTERREPLTPPAYDGTMRHAQLYLSCAYIVYVINKTGVVLEWREFLLLDDMNMHVIGSFFSKKI
jgi:hypothetical protein